MRYSLDAVSITKVMSALRSAEVESRPLAEVSMWIDAMKTGLALVALVSLVRFIWNAFENKASGQAALWAHLIHSVILYPVVFLVGFVGTIFVR
jgi:hypothetical protein